MMRRNFKAELNTRTQSLVPPGKSYDSTTFNAILLTESEVGDSDEENIKSKAADALTLALKKEELHIKDVRGESFVGNRTGLNLAGLAMQLDTFQKKFEEELTSSKTQVGELNERVLTLEMFSEGYKKLRKRFLTAFKSKLFDIQSTTYKEIIQEGNNSAHRGDVLVDATLCILSEEGQEEQERNTLAFEKLYGLEPLLVSQIKRNETIEALNAHASMISSTKKNKKTPTKCLELFVKFMELLKDSGYDESYLDGEDPSELANAYRSFRKCADTWLEKL